MLRHAAELADGRRDRAFERERRRMLDAPGPGPGAGGSSPSRNGFRDLSLSEGAELSRVAYDLRYHDVVAAVMCEEARRTTAGLRAAKRAMADFALGVRVIRSELRDLRKLHVAAWCEDGVGNSGSDDEDAVRVDKELRLLVLRFFAELDKTFF
ncbi:hypothetical protein CMUS01_09546 [Colletotrichum musicola]|uniref:Uncharacterized protein n=1 Tax=Colletotrichum musicola TaxID=2175873 RepID=A0A8H6K6Y4_9PEZI|nr:hypothetical protein CMUS01_09546 [Colletotrichum musicola]